jgi:TldD protein
MQELLERVLAAATRLGAAFADIRVVESAGTSILVQDGRADSIAAGDSCGAGIRVLVDGAWGFAPTNRIEEPELLQCVRDAIAMARAASPAVTDPGMVAEVEAVQDRIVSSYRIDPRDVPLEDRVAAAYELEQVARQEAGGKLTNSAVSYGDGAGTMWLANTYGTYTESTGVRCGVSAFVAAGENGELQWSSRRKGLLTGYELMEELDYDDFAGKAARKAVALLAAERAPAGRFDVVIDPIICGLLTHEAFGHNCEADAVWAGESILEGKEGTQVAHEDVTIVDDPTIPGVNGSYVYDHEGTPGERHLLVENGILTSYLHSLETAARLEERPNGAARGQGHTYPPIVRMSNSFIAPGDWSFEEMLAEMKSGLYLTGGNWGYVFTARGQFTCNVEEAYAIEDGQLGQHYRNVSISGLTLEALRNVSAVGNDLQFELGGVCGKNGQSANVDAGGPHVRIHGVLVGGQE